MNTTIFQFNFVKIEIADTWELFSVTDWHCPGTERVNLWWVSYVSYIYNVRNNSIFEDARNEWDSPARV